MGAMHIAGGGIAQIGAVGCSQIGLVEVVGPKNLFLLVLQLIRVLLVLNPFVLGGEEGGFQGRLSQVQRGGRGQGRVEGLGDF